METNNYIVYKHTSPSGKYYIGITSRTLEQRCGPNGYNYLVTLPNGSLKHPYFANAILKYGWDNISHEILHSNISKGEACKLERKYISEAKNMKLSYNITDGGEGHSGCKFSPEVIEKIRKSHIGKKQSPSTIAKRVAKNTGKIRSSAQKAKTSRPVVQLDLHGNIIASYFGAREACRQTGINNAHITDCCNHKPNRKTAGGFKWEWQSV